MKAMIAVMLLASGVPFESIVEIPATLYPY